MVFNLVLCLCLIFTLGQSDITGVTVPTLVVSSCTTNSDCHNYINSKCSGGTCTQCTANSDCDHIYSPGNCQDYGCEIPCSTSNPSSLLLCYAQRIMCNGARCQQCNSDGDCSGYPSPVSCIYYDSDPNFCGACSSNSDCGSGYQCKNLQCWQCSGDADCPTSNPFCLTSFEINSCKPCGNSDNSYCTSWQTPKCSGNLCVTCGQNSDCDHISGRPTCYNGKCVVCTDSSQCTDITASYCNPSTGVCEHCQSNNDCTKFSDTKTCAGSVGCVECQDSSACTTPLKSSCDVTNKICQTCTGAGDCTKFPLAPMCTAGGCVGCTTETDCTDITKSFCDTSDHSCKPCQSSSDCTRFSLTPVCNYPATPTQCVQCLTSASDCKSPTESYCNTGTNLCETCTDDSECSHLPATLLCSTADSRCVQCKSNTDCPDVAKSACESTTKTCQLCSSNGDCSHLTSTPVCISSGCVECAANTDCMSTTSSFCSPNLHTCQACNSDSQCTHIPNMNQCWKGECVEYSATCIPSYDIKITQGNPSTIFYLQFPSDLVALTNIPQELYLTLDDVDSVYYQYSLTNTSTTDYIITFTVLKTIPKTTLTIELPCPTQPGMRFGNITQSLKTLKMAYSPAGLAATMQTIGSVAQTASTSITAISGAMMFMGANPAILWALIGLLQTFYYMLFINVQYPSNVEAFFPVFTLGTFDFIPNPMWIIFSDINDFSLPVPQKFADYNVDGLFLATSGNMILLWGLNLAAYGFSYLFMRYTRNMPQVITKVCSKTVSVFEWSGTIRTFTTSFMDISVSSFLQLRVLTWTSGLFATSSVCGLLFGLFSVLLPVIAFKIVQLYDTRPTYISMKFSTLIEEYRLNDGIQKYFTVIGLGKNLIFAASLVYLHNYPYTEIITIISLSFSYTYLIWKYKPYDSKVSTYANIVSEGIFGVVYVFIFILIHDDYSPKFTDDQRLNLGWGIILGCGIILMSSIVIALAEQYSVIKNGIIMMKNVMRKSSKTKEERMKKLKARIDKTNPTIEQFNNDRSFAENSELLDTDLLNLSRNQQLKLTRLKRVRRDFNKNIHK